MTFDLELSDPRGSCNFVTLPRPVLQRLLDRWTKALLIHPGALTRSIYASEDERSAARSCMSTWSRASRIRP